MGDYLLSGWAMTAEHCEKCLIPILKKNEKMICINCDCEEEKNTQVQ